MKSVLRANLQEYNLTLQCPSPPREYFALFFDLKRLLKKLQVYDLNTNSLKWFQSYLSGMYQKACVDGKLPEPLGIHSGVLQGSILGPALFLLVINDLPLVLKNNIGIHADDPTLYASAHLS